MSQRRYLAIAGVAGALGVGFGALAAHGLESRLTPEQMAWWETGVTYHMYHALAMLAAAAATPTLWRSGWVPWASTLWLAGIVLFSGSLYLLALTDARWLGMITPFGGMAFIFGWCSLIPAAWLAWKDSGTATS